MTGVPDIGPASRGLLLLNLLPSLLLPLCLIAIPSLAMLNIIDAVFDNNIIVVPLASVIKKYFEKKMILFEEFFGIFLKDTVVLVKKNAPN